MLIDWLVVAVTFLSGAVVIGAVVIAVSVCVLPEFLDWMLDRFDNLIYYSFRNWAWRWRRKREIRQGR